jgi:hypothetical protein
METSKQNTRELGSLTQDDYHPCHHFMWGERLLNSTKPLAAFCRGVMLETGFFLSRTASKCAWNFSLSPSLSLSLSDLNSTSLAYLSIYLFVTWRRPPRGGP